MRDGGDDGEKRGGENMWGHMAPPEQALLLKGNTFLKRKVSPTASRATDLKNVTPLKLQLMSEPKARTKTFRVGNFFVAPTDSLISP
jgi:hypothetical protein